VEIFLNLAWTALSLLLLGSWIWSIRITGNGLEEGCIDEMRPVVMACLAAGFGLLPASLSNGIGAQAQQPLARVVVGGMITTIIVVLFILPLFLRQSPQPIQKE